MATVSQADTPELRIDGAVATLTLRRPQQANRLEPADLLAISEHVARVNATPQVLVLRVQATGKTFCAGYDIGQIGGARPVAFEDMVNALEDARPVTMALLQGGVYGGATDLALACDFRLGSTSTEMFMPAARLGLHYYRSGIARYVSRLGVDNAKMLFLTAQKISAPEMLRIGYLTAMVPVETLDEEVDKLAGILAGNAPQAMRGMKRAINEFARGELDEQAADQRHRDSMRGDEIKEGIKAFAEKRPPKF
jgi:enoyl-CoA hydratase/carnithine racemase